MAILIDTNVLLRSVQPSHLLHANAIRALQVLIRRQSMLVVVLQNIAEFWNVATRPVQYNGLGFTIEEAQNELRQTKTYWKD